MASKRTGKPHAGDRFTAMVSPLGKDAAQTPEYSPDRAIEHGVPSNQRRRGPDTESARNERRGG